MSEQMRKEFENWAVATKDQFGLPFFVMKDEQGKYIDHAAEISWQAWQASRAAIVVELPDWFTVHGIDSAFYCDEVIAVLNKAGVSHE